MKVFNATGEPIEMYKLDNLEVTIPNDRDIDHITTSISYVMRNGVKYNPFRGCGSFSTRENSTYRATLNENEIIFTRNAGGSTVTLRSA